MIRPGLLVLTMACLLLIGCGAPAARKGDKETFDRLYGEYRQRVYQAVGRDIEKMTYNNVLSLAQETWDDVFKEHADLLRRLAEAELAALPAACPPDPQRYRVQEGRNVSSFEPFGVNSCRGRLASDLYSPVGAARKGNWWNFDDPTPLGVYSACWVAAEFKVEALDRSVDHPKLQMQSGPTIVQVDLEWAGLQYRVMESRMYYPKGRGILAEEPGWNDPLKVVLAPDGSMEVDGKTVLLKDIAFETQRRPSAGISIQVADPAKSTYGQLLGILDVIPSDPRDGFGAILVNDMPLRFPRLARFLDVDFGGGFHPRCDMNDPDQLRKYREAEERLPLFLQVWLCGKPDTPMATVLAHLKALNELDLGVGFLREWPPRQPSPKK